MKRLHRKLSLVCYHNPLDIVHKLEKEIL
uniref:Uncharacterized protein n=1 Tax=Anguilla anguilla TaxID=7936 RepID=A0A0E9REN6_ANGAN